MEQLAITVNINPETYVTYKKVRNKWKFHTQQQEFLEENVVSPLFNLIDIHGYELTQANNVHVHILLTPRTVDDLGHIEKTKEYLFKTLPKMTMELKRRCWFQEPAYDAPSWKTYCLKDQHLNSSKPESHAPLEVCSVEQTNFDVCIDSPTDSEPQVSKLTVPLWYRKP